MPATFTSLDFGEADAETESRHKADLLLAGFFDPFGAARRVMDREVTVLLGPKGSGKSSVLQHLRLSAGHDTFLRTIRIGDLPFTDFTKVRMGDSSPETRSPTAWKFFLLSYLFESLAEDPLLEGDGELIRGALSALENEGVRPSKDLRESVLKLSRVTAKVALPFSIGEVEGSLERVPRDRQFLGSVAEQLVRLVERLRSPNRHLLFVDGLDEFFRPSETNQDEVIGGLVYAAHQLNGRFLDSGAPCGVVVACRTEIFDRLPLSDTNRIKQTAGVVVDWASNEDDPNDSLLFDLVNHKVNAASRFDITGVIEQFFPARIVVGGGSVQIPTAEFILDRTRRVPRDLLRLFEFIRRATTPGQLPSNRDVIVGSREYAKGYLLSEVRNELTSTCDKEAAETVLKRISRLDGHIFTRAAIEGPLPNGVELAEVLEALYQAGALGYLSRRSGYVNFRYRNEAVGFSDTSDLILHNAIITAYNIPRGKVK